MTKFLNIKKEYIMPLTSLVVVGTALVLALSMFFNSSLGWLAKNDAVEANGMNVSVRGVPDIDQYITVGGVRVSEDATNIFSALRPENNYNKVEFQLHVINKTDEPINFQLFMAAPKESNDTPYVVDGLYHYFGTQIRINSIKNSDSDVLSLVGNDRYLLTLDNALYIGDSSNLPPTAINQEYDFNSLTEKTLTGVIEISAGDELILDFELEFVDNGTLQNAYIDFGNPNAEDTAKAALRLSRTLVCSVSYVK